MTIAIISHPDCLLHQLKDDHPEQPARLDVIQAALSASPIQHLLKYYEAPFAKQQHLEFAHSKAYIETIFRLSPPQGYTEIDGDTAMNPYTLAAALRAAGAVIYAVDLLMAQEVNAAFCNIRPPGHHAERNKAMGFCFFNNIAIGVYHALTQYKLKRIAIIDFDVHHGNGTENIFKDEKRVLLCSSFQYPFYPFSGVERNPYAINLPLPAGTTSREFRAEIEQNWLLALDNFKPELIFFSAGFDGHAQDPMSNTLLTENDYAWLTRRIRQIAERHCQGRMISALEGGYALNVLGSCAVAHINAMTADEILYPE